VHPVILMLRKMSVPMVYSLTERYFGQCLLVLSSEAHIFTGVPLATEPGISLIILPLMRILKRNLTHSTDTFLFTSHTTNVLLFKFRCNIYTGVRIIKEMPGSVASGTLSIKDIQGVTGGTDQTSGECSLCQTVPI